MPIIIRLIPWVIAFALATGFGMQCSRISNLKEELQSKCPEFPKGSGVTTKTEETTTITVKPGRTETYVAKPLPAPKPAISKPATSSLSSGGGSAGGSLAQDCNQINTYLDTVEFSETTAKVFLKTEVKGTLLSRDVQLQAQIDTVIVERQKTITNTVTLPETWKVYATAGGVKEFDRYNATVGATLTTPGGLLVGFDKGIIKNTYGAKVGFKLRLKK